MFSTKTVIQSSTSGSMARKAVVEYKFATSLRFDAWRVPFKSVNKSLKGASGALDASYQDD